MNECNPCDLLHTAVIFKIALERFHIIRTVCAVEFFKRTQRFVIYLVQYRCIFYMYKQLVYAHIAVGYTVFAVQGSHLERHYRLAVTGGYCGVPLL